MDMTHEIPRSNDLPVTVQMFNEFRSENSARLNAFEGRMNARFASIDSGFKSIDARFASVDARFASIDARFEELFAQGHQIRLLMETQTAQNAIALDGVRHALAEVAEVRRIQSETINKNS
jgi:hypothetical protein